MAASHKGTVLVVDDEEIMRDILETLLTRDGYDVRLACSGEEVRRMLRPAPAPREVAVARIGAKRGHVLPHQGKQPVRAVLGRRMRATGIAGLRHHPGGRPLAGRT